MRDLAALILLAAAAVLLFLIGQPKHQALLIDPTPAAYPDGTPFAVPHEGLLLSPCPLTPRNVPALKRRLA